MRLVHEVMQAWSKAEKPMRRDKEGFHKVTVERKMKPWVYSLCRLRVAVKRKAKNVMSKQIIWLKKRMQLRII